MFGMFGMIGYVLGIVCLLLVIPCILKATAQYMERKWYQFVYTMFLCACLLLAGTFWVAVYHGWID